MPWLSQASNLGASSVNSRATEIPTDVNPSSWARRFNHAARLAATCLVLDML